MFCYQCEQTARGEGCTKSGVCGKEPDVAALQDLLVYVLSELSFYAEKGRNAGIIDHDSDVFALEALFATLTNVDFDPERFVELINRATTLKDSLKEKLGKAGIDVDLPAGFSSFTPETTMEGLIKQGEAVQIRPDNSTPDITSLKHTLLFGLKGVAAYAYHARILNQEDDAVYAFIHEALVAIFRRTIDLNEALSLVLKCGEINLKTMEILDAANTGAYGHPVPTKVPLGAKKGKAILVSGHDPRIWKKY